VGNRPILEVDFLGNVTVTQIARIGHELGVRHPIVDAAVRGNFNNLDEANLITGDFTGLIKLIQKKLGVTENGEFGPLTVAAYERNPNAKVPLRDSKTAKQVLQWIADNWVASKCKCSFDYGAILALIHYESMDKSTGRNGGATYFNAIGGPAGQTVSGRRTTAVGLGQFVIGTAATAGLSYQERYDGERSVGAVLRHIYNLAGTKCDFETALAQWEAWTRNRTDIKRKGADIDRLIQKAGDFDKISNADLDRILGIR
jgi:hypothetical protein